MIQTLGYTSCGIAVWKFPQLLTTGAKSWVAAFLFVSFLVILGYIRHMRLYICKLFFLMFWYNQDITK